MNFQIYPLCVQALENCSAGIRGATWAARVPNANKREKRSAPLLSSPLAPRVFPWEREGEKKIIKNKF